MKYRLEFSFEDWMALRRKHQTGGKDQIISWLDVHDEDCSFEVELNHIAVIFSNRSKAAMFKLNFM